MPFLPCEYGERGTSWIRCNRMLLLQSTENDLIINDDCMKSERILNKPRVQDRITQSAI